MIVAMWAGGILADLWFVVTGAGLVATPSPGSIFAYLAVTPPGSYFSVLGGVVVGIGGSFITGTILLRFFPVKDTAEEKKELPVEQAQQVPQASMGTPLLADS
jgi:PTS system mannitol-specific IIC component